VLVEPDNEFGRDEPWRHVAPDDQGGLLRKLGEEVRRPRAVAGQPGDHRALRVVFMFGNDLTVKRLIPEIAGQDEIEILRHLIPSEAEERVFGLEVADLQDTANLGVKARTAGGESQFRSGQRQIGQLLAAVEIGQPVQGELLRVR
jgi:hypothetical protein